MKRRDFIAGGCAVTLAVPASLVAAEDQQDDHKDKYWQAQAHINAVEQELSELRAHAQIMRKRMTNRVDFDPTDGTITVYDDDGVTPLVEGV